MRVFVAGATGAIGRRLVPQLIERGHDVVGTYRSSSEEADRLRGRGATIRQLDLLDAAATRQAVLDAKPDAIVHEATALAGGGFSRKLDKPFAQTNRLRTAGTDALLAVAAEAGVGRFVAQSFAAYRYARQGGMVKTEDDPLDPSPPAGAHETNAAMAHVDDAVTDSSCSPAPCSDRTWSWARAHPDRDLPCRRVYPGRDPARRRGVDRGPRVALPWPGQQRTPGRSTQPLEQPGPSCAR